MGSFVDEAISTADIGCVGLSPESRRVERKCVVMSRMMILKCSPYMESENISETKKIKIFELITCSKHLKHLENCAFLKTPCIYNKPLVRLLKLGVLRKAEFPIVPSTTSFAIVVVSNINATCHIFPGKFPIFFLFVLCLNILRAS